MSGHKNCCCGGATQINCAEWCACLPQQATLQGLVIEITQVTYCGNAIESRREISLNIQDVTLVNSQLCYMVSDGQSGTWSFVDRFKDYRSPPDGIINRLGCPNVNCVYQCDHRELCRTTTISASGVHPGASIHCDNPCQPPFGITDAFSRLDWFIDGEVFTETDLGSNAYPDLDAHLACRFPSPPNNPALQHGPCSSYFDSTLGPFYSSRQGSVFGKRGCLNGQSFSQFNACNSIGLLLDPNTIPPVTGNGACANPMGLPTCYVCSGGTMVPNQQISGASYSFEACETNACCDNHKCMDYQGGVIPQVELFCCGEVNHCGVCQNYAANTYLGRRTVWTWSTQMNITVP